MVYDKQHLLFQKLKFPVFFVFIIEKVSYKYKNSYQFYCLFQLFDSQFWKNNSATVQIFSILLKHNFVVCHEAFVISIICECYSRDLNSERNLVTVILLGFIRNYC